MATQSTANGTGESLTMAEKLMQKHTANDGHNHNVTLEDVPDEDDLQHPPPSTTNGTSQPISDKAAGKQPETTAPKPSTPAIDTKSEELFPSLGAPKTTNAPSTWSKKPAVVNVGGGPNGFTNGVAKNNASRGPAPASGFVTPVGLPTMNLPGKHTERVSFAPSQLTPRNQLRKPAHEVLRDINRRSKAEVKMLTGQGGNVIFEGTGPVEAVRQALKEVAKELGSKQTAKVTIPASVRPHIIGKAGSTIQKLSQRTGARIQVPRQDVAEGLADDDDANTVDVVIEGDAISAEMARREIEAIVNERTSSVNMRLKDIPHEYYPFLAGPHNVRTSALENGRDVRIQIPHYHRVVGDAPQLPSNRQPVQFAPQGRLPISISGDRRAAQEVREQLERQVEQLRRQLTIEQMAIERGRHQFIIGEKAAGLHDFLQETGCSIIFPPDDEDSETLLIVGPADKIEEAQNRVMDLASSMTMSSVDIARQFPNAQNGAQAHARNVTRYLQQRRALEELEKAHNARIVAQSGRNASTNWEVYSKDGKNAMRARSEIMNLISAHPPSRFAPVPIDPFFHNHLRKEAASHVRDQYGVHLLVPDDFSDEPEVLLIYEGGSPADFQISKRQPSSQEANEFARALKEAQQHILGLTSGHSNIVSRDLDAPTKFHDKIRRHVNKQHESLPQGRIPVQVRVGGQPAQKKAAAPQVSMRGPQDAVEELFKNLVAFIEQEEKDELERGFTLSFDFPKEYANQLIGKSGSNIKKLRDEFDVDIQVNDGKVEIKGPEAKANACKAHIKSLEKKLADEATHQLKIPAQYHKDLIGPKGAQVNRLQDRYKVRINFPRSANTADDDASVAEDQAPRKSNQAPDEVVVRGPKKGADEARDELLSLLQYVKDNSHSATISVATSQLPSLIGSGGRELEALRLATGAQIDVPNNREGDSSSARAEVKVRGTKKAVEEAKKRIEESAKVFDSTVTREIEVDKKHHRSIIGGGGEGIRRIVLSAGGPDDRQRINRMVRFPRAEDTESNTIRIEGDSDVVDKIISQIQSFATNRDSQTTEHITVAPEKHRLLIGRGGEIRRSLESKFNISLDIPKQTVTGDARSQVKIAGQPSDVEKAKAHIAELTKDQEGTTITIPAKYHHSISDNGQLFRRLRSDHKVTVDHNGQKPPAKTSAPTPQRSAGSALPLITDDAPSAEPHWETHSLHSDTEGTIPWVLSGPSASEVDKAKERIERALCEAEKSDTVGFLILPDPRSYRLVIGPGGAEINRIRKETGTKVQVPGGKGRGGSGGSGEGEAIEIVGSKEGVEKARGEILKAVGRG
ncbi:putative RNA binding effector protein Scp160 [Elsinoe ampelina]|uniref:Putative RNA binding effector protein Scp160 n=1 Tax=Elsinoe ampelina TaxID=302913 RepID=A0A6A6GQ10_9PEZI|nr:putative RNA binding effector protein Scp160 [Elsinoe ampelina]